MTATAAAAGDGVVLRDVMIPMRDGVRLATDVHLPARTGAHPVLLHRTPYGKHLTRESEISRADPTPRSNHAVAAELAQAGFAVATQDCRGRYASEGQFAKYLGEGEDGADTMAWLMAQPWCDGRIGTFGLSYSAHVQTAAAALRPPGLSAMFLDSGGFWNAWRGGVRYGGAFEMKQATWAFRHARLSPAAADPVVAAALDAEDIGAWFKATPWRRGHSPLRHTPDYEDHLFGQWENGAFGPYWDRPELHAAPHYRAFAHVPTFLITGWFDPYAETICEHFKALSALGAPVAMAMGPWLHGRRSQSFAGDADFGPDSLLDGALAPDYATLRRSWFQRWMPPADAPPAPPDPPRARWFRMGGGDGGRDAAGRRRCGGAWRQADVFPPPDAREMALHLTAGGGLTDRPPEDGALSMQVDPARPVPTIGGAITSGAPVMAGGAFDQRTHAGVFGAEPPFLPLAARADVMVFATEPLAQDVEIAGPVLARLWVAIDGPDADIAIKLIDWAPPCRDWPQGWAMNLTDGILRLRYRDSAADPRPMVPGAVVEVAVAAPPTAALLRAGHRIRLDIAGANFPRFDVNPQTGEPEGRARLRRVGVTTLHMGAARPSRLVLSARAPTAP